MNERIQSLISQAQEEVWGTNPHNGSPEFEGYQINAEKLAVAIIQECARQALHTQLEDVEGGDSAVLSAASTSILSLLVNSS